MKRIIVIATCILLVFSGCKKNSNVAPANTISADIDGVTENFNTRAIATLSTGPTSNSGFTILGTNGATSDSDFLSITVAINQTITTGSYTSDTSFVSILYKFGPSSIDNLNDYHTDLAGSPSTVVITKLTSTNIQGTFSGKLVYGSASKTVTNGKFNLTLK